MGGLIVNRCADGQEGGRIGGKKGRQINGNRYIDRKKYM
jgi:hypothetical protein